MLFVAEHLQASCLTYTLHFETHKKGKLSCLNYLRGEIMALVKNEIAILVQPNVSQSLHVAADKKKKDLCELCLSFPTII